MLLVRVLSLGASCLRAVTDLRPTLIMIKGFRLSLASTTRHKIGISIPRRHTDQDFLTATRKMFLSTKRDYSILIRRHIQLHIGYLVLAQGIPFISREVALLNRQSTSPICWITSISSKVRTRPGQAGKSRETLFSKSRCTFNNNSEQ